MCAVTVVIERSLGGRGPRGRGCGAVTDNPVEAVTLRIESCLGEFVVERDVLAAGRERPIAQRSPDGLDDVLHMLLAAERRPNMHGQALIGAVLRPRAPVLRPRAPVAKGALAERDEGEARCLRRPIEDPHATEQRREVARSLERLVDAIAERLTLN